MRLTEIKPLPEPIEPEKKETIMDLFQSILDKCEELKKLQNESTEQAKEAFKPLPF